MFYKKSKKKSVKSPLKSAIKKLDITFSKYIRLRDSRCGSFMCCSCGKIKTVEQMDCGHFFSRRFMAIRWNEKNAHGQCRHCNRFSQGMQYDYMRFMLKKYGQETVDQLDSVKNLRRPFSAFEIVALEKMYQEKIDSL